MRSTSMPITVLVAVLSAATAQLQLFEAGPMGEPIQNLTDGSTICPDDYANGFNIKCMGGETDPAAVFFLDGKRVRKDRRMPFFIGGSSRTMVRAWRGFGDMNTIRCRTRSGTWSAKLTFGCPEPTPSPELGAPPATMFFRAAGVASSTDNQVEVTRRIKFCPERDVGTKDFTVFCTPSDSSAKAVFRVNGGKVFKDVETPYYIGGDIGGVPNAWADVPVGRFTLVCSLGGGVKSQIHGVMIECPVVVMPEVTVMPKATDMPDMA